MKVSPKQIQMGKVLAIASLGVAGFLGVAACATEVPAVLTSTISTENNSVARNIARIAIGDGGLTALNQGGGQAYLATCDPGTV